ncbi:MAG: acyltransferase family protein [Muribaculaceae bacterium]|nr:acyltransferase family protein [Muribaculaceae bacterium]
MARDPRIDSLKGFLIILVILGHVITSLDNTNVVNHAVMGLIYIFHMPLFILLSGYLTKPPESQKSKDMWCGVLKIFVPLIIFHLIYCIHNAYKLGFSIDSYLTVLKNFPSGILWYLMSLIFWRIMLYYSPKALLKRPTVYIAIALIVSILCGLTHLGRPFSIQRTLNFYVFFLLGYYYRQNALNKQWWSNNILHVAVAVILLPLIFYLYPRCGNVMNGLDHYDWKDLPEKILILACSIAMSLLVFNLMRDFKPLRAIGKESLFYYLYHFLFITEVVYPIVSTYDWPRTLPFILLYTAAITAMVFAISKIPVFKWIMDPLTPLTKASGKKPT